MKQRFTYDCVLIKEDDGYCASFPQVPGAFADGDTREEAMIDSIERYAAQERHAGRPKKFVAVQ